ncbi:MAG: RNA polymerase sigma factor [Planctomycetota bacterium]
MDRTDELSRRLVAEMPALRAWLGRLAGAEADDVLQDVLARAWRYRSAYDASQPIGGWLRQIARRVWIDRHQRANPDPERLGDRAETLPAPRASDPALREDIEHRLEKLRPIERDILLRFHRDGLSIAEIAAELGHPVGTVKSHLHRARQRLTGAGPSPSPRGES